MCVMSPSGWSLAASSAVCPCPACTWSQGAALIAQAGVSIYRVQSVKRSAQRRWLLLDGGMADNPRPALYSARYSALPLADPDRSEVGPAWLAGPYCESGDILIQDLPMPDVAPGDTSPSRSAERTTLAWAAIITAPANLPCYGWKMGMLSLSSAVRLLKTYTAGIIL